MEFHEHLHDLAAKEGLKGRKLHKAVESFTWNITILKVRTTMTVVCLSSCLKNIQLPHCRICDFLSTN